MSNVRPTEKGFLNSNVFGEVPSDCLTELLSTRYVMYSTRDQFFTFPTSNRMFRMAIHFLVRSFDYAIFFLVVRYRSMVCDTHLLVEV